MGGPKVMDMFNPCVHSAEKLCPLNRLQTQPYQRMVPWYQARVHPFSSGNGKGVIIFIGILIINFYL